MSEPNKTFNELLADHFEILDVYTTAITRAHGRNHPESFEIVGLFEIITSKVKNAGENKPDLNAEFAQLRHITDNYTIPEDVCETYAGTHEMLSKIDQAYQA